MKLIDLSFFALALAACGGSSPSPAAPSTQAATTASAAPAAPAPSASASADGDDSQQAASASGDATDDANAPAKTYTIDFPWSENPSIDRAPKDGAYVSIGGRTLKANVKVTYDKKRNQWTFDARANDGDADLGPSIDTKGSKPSVGTVHKPMPTTTMFQVPQHGNSAKKFDETTSLNSDAAWTIQITKITPPAAGHDGKVSGRFVVVMKDLDEKRKLWAAGTFTDAPYSVW